MGAKTCQCLAVWAAPFDPGRLALTGAPVRVVEDLLTFSAGGAANYAVTPDGTLVYVPTSVGVVETYTLVRVERDGSNPAPLHDDTLEDPRHLQLSPNGERLAVVTGPRGRSGIWLYWLDGRPPVPPRQRGRHSYPVWTHAGTRIVFATGTGGNQPDLVWVAADGTTGEPDCDSPGPSSSTRRPG